MAHSAARIHPALKATDISKILIIASKQCSCPSSSPTSTPYPVLSGGFEQLVYVPFSSQQTPQDANYSIKPEYLLFWKPALLLSIRLRFSDLQPDEQQLQLR